jgi:hypothetical protein
MPTSNTTLRVTELDFVNIKENLKTFLRSQSEFQDFDFEGSGMSVLLDILAYNTHYMSYYANMVGNEMFLDTAQLRPSILSHAKHINYIPSSRSASKARVNIVVTPSTTEDNITNIITLDRYTQFLGKEIEGTNYPFVSLYSNTVNKVNGSFTFSNTNLIQGVVNSLQFLMDDNTNPKRRFRIPSANVDTQTISILVQESTTNTFASQYNLMRDITEINANSEVYFLEETEDSTYSFYFGDDVLGKKPKNGNVIICTYIDTSGEQANNISDFVLVDSINGYRDNVIITASSKSFGGTEKETIEDIRFRAPYGYIAQNRAVTKLDYETLITKDYSNIDSVSVWGGEENDPVVYGKVYASLKTKNNYELSLIEKEAIKEDLIRNRNVLTVIPEIVDPDFVFLQVIGSVYYNSSLTQRTSEQLKSLVTAAIIDYNNLELNKFNTVFRKNVLQRYIESVDRAVTGTEIKIYLQKRLPIETNFNKNYIVKYNLPIKKGDFIEKLVTFPTVTVKDVTGIDRQVFFEEVPNSFTGIDKITVVNVGRNYQTPPRVTITGDGTGATAQAVIVNGRVKRIDILTKGINYTRATVSITGGGGSEASATALPESKFGLLRTYYFRNNGEKAIVNPNAGTINYETGEILLTSLLAQEVTLNDFFDENILSIDVPSANENIFPLRNRILSIDFNNPTSIQIDMVAEK